MKTEATIIGSNEQSRPSVSWYAKGFGSIKSEYQDANGNVLSTSALQTIIVAP